MTEEQKQKASIHELSYDLGCRIVRLYQYLTGEVQGSWSWVMGYSLEETQEPSIQNQEPFAYEYVMSKQIYRSGTSVGANVRELMEQREQSLKLACLLCRVVTAEDASQSKHAQSDADFLSKMSIASKEADETDFWLNMLHDRSAASYKIE